MREEAEESTYDDNDDLVLVKFEWPCGFRFGDAVIDSRMNKGAFVVPGDPDKVPMGHVPILYADATRCFATVPATELMNLSRPN